MKKIITLAMLVIGFSLFSQSNKEEIEYYQSIFGMEKKQIVMQLVSPSEETSEAFWTLYDEYEDARKELGQKRIELLNKYAEQYGDMSEEHVNEVIKEMMTQSAATEKLITTYYAKIKKSVDPVTAAQFYQLENYFLSEIRVLIFNNIPLIGELKVDD